MDNITGHPIRTFQLWIANPKVSILLPTTFVLRGDVAAAERLMPMAVGALQAMRRDNVNNLPQYGKQVLVGGGRTVIDCVTRFGVETVTVYVLPRLLKKVEEEVRVEESSYPAVMFGMCTWPLGFSPDSDYEAYRDAVVHATFGAYICTGLDWIPDMFYLGKEESAEEKNKEAADSGQLYWKSGKEGDVLVWGWYDALYSTPPLYSPITNWSLDIPDATIPEGTVRNLTMIGGSSKFGDIDTNWAVLIDEDERDMPICVENENTSYPPQYEHDPLCIPPWEDGQHLTKYEYWTYKQWYKGFNRINGRVYYDETYTEWGHQWFSYTIEEHTWSPTPPIEQPWLAPHHPKYWVLRDGTEVWDEFRDGYNTDILACSTVQSASAYGYADGAHDIVVMERVKFFLDYSYSVVSDGYNSTENKYYPDYGVKEWYQTHGYPAMNDITYYQNRPDRWGISGSYVFHWQTGLPVEEEMIRDNTIVGLPTDGDWWWSATKELVVVVDGEERLIEIPGIADFPHRDKPTTLPHYAEFEARCAIYDYGGKPIFVASIITRVITNHEVPLDRKIGWLYDVYITYISVYNGEWSIRTVGPTDGVDGVHYLNLQGYPVITADSFWDIKDSRADKGMSGNQYASAVRVTKKTTTT